MFGWVGGNSELSDGDGEEGGGLEEEYVFWRLAMRVLVGGLVR